MASEASPHGAKRYRPGMAWHLQGINDCTGQEFEEIYNLAMSLTVENDHATVVRAAPLDILDRLIDWL